VRLGEAPSHGMPAVIYDAKSRGAAAYVALAQELATKHTKNRHEEREARHEEHKDHAELSERTS
jgi:chromosome partitioning protein